MRIARLFLICALKWEKSTVALNPKMRKKRKAFATAGRQADMFDWFGLRWDGMGLLGVVESTDK